MESEKSRFISIPAARAVDSSKPRVSVSAVAADAFLLSRSASGSFSAGSVPIRAPLTIDDDDGSVSEEHNSDSSDASSYSRGLDSGTDDGFESVLGEADDETALDDVLVGGIRVHRLLGEDPARETGEGSDGSVSFRPFAGNIDEETSVNYSSLEEESQNSDDFSESEVSEADRVSMKAKVVIPRAILSLDDDEFDEILGSGDEEAVLLNPGIAEVEVNALHFGDIGMVEETKCLDPGISDLVSTEEEVVGVNYSDKLDNGLMSENIGEQNLTVPAGGCDGTVVENEGNSSVGSMGSSESFKEIIEKGVLQRSIIQDDVSGSIHEVDVCLKPGDVEGVENSVIESTEVGIADKTECSGSVRCDLGSSEEDVIQLKFSDDGLVSFDTTEGNSPGVAQGDCNEFQVESERNNVGEGSGLDETLSHLFKQRVGQGSISKGSNNRSDDALMIPDKGSLGLGSTKSGDEGTENIIGEAKECCENDYGIVERLGKPEREGEPEIGMSSESFQLTPTLESVTSTELEVAEGIVFVSGCCSTNLNNELEFENEGKQEPEKIERNFYFPDEDTANEQIPEQVGFQSDSEPNQISVSIEESSLLSANDVERIMPEQFSVIANDKTENEKQIAQLIHNHTFMELDEYEGTGNSKEKLSEPNFQNGIHLISEKVKEKVEKTQFLKEKLQRIIGRTYILSDNSSDTDVVSKLSIAGGEHQGLDYVSGGGTKMMLPEKEHPNDPDFSINVLVIGKTGVGKSATINSIFGETKSPVGAFGVTTKSVEYVVGNVGGSLIRILDTPGLMSAATEEHFNQEVLMSIKTSMRTFPVDVILYINRLDEYPDIHLLGLITSSLGSSIWRNTIVVLTHAATDVPDSVSYKDFIAQRFSLMHQSIRQAVPELSKMPEIVLAENSMSCGNKTSETTSLDWRLNLVILCCSVKIRSKAGSSQNQDTLLRSFAQFCSLWNVLLHGANSRRSSHSHDVLSDKKRNLLDSSHSEIFWDEPNQQCLEQETLLMKDQEQSKKPGLEKGYVLGRVRSRRGRLGFQATKRFGIYLDTCDLYTGFSIGSRGCKKEEQEGKMLLKMRGSVSVLGLVPKVISVFTSVYGRKDS